MDLRGEHDLWDELGFEEGRDARFGHCVLHIGTEKTGSTSLQGFLGANRAALLRAGVVVPASLSPYDVAANHERLTTYALADEKIGDDLRVKAQVGTAAAVPAYRAAIAQALREEIARLPDDRPAQARTLLLSNEHCHSRLVEIAEVARLKAFVQEFARTVRVVVYLRPQHELAVSLFDQALKSGYADISPIPDFSGRTPLWVHRGFFDYADLLERWAAVFGAAAIEVAIYGAELRNGSVIDDFMARLGIGMDGMTTEPNRNIGMDAQRQVALNAVNRFMRAQGQTLPPGVRARLIDQFQRSSRGGGLLPTRAAAEAFERSFAAGNERVRATFLPERAALFAAAFSRYPEVAETPDEAEALAATIVAGLLG